MIPVFADLESFWSQTHSLSKMNPIEYCMHPDTEIISCSIKVGRQGKTIVAFGEERVREELEAIDWSDKMLIAHNNSEFDAMIFAWRFHIKPKMWGCTLAMARPIHGKTIGCSLAKLVEHYGLGVKNNAVLLQTKGRHLCDFSPQEITDMAKYNMEDTDQCAELFYKLLPRTSVDELKVIDLTMRMLVEPKFVLDIPLLEQTLLDVREAKQRALLDVSHLVGIEDEVNALVGMDRAEAVRSVLASAPKFSGVLVSLGVDVPMKPSPANPLNSIPALAKSDQGFLDLLEHDDIRVAAVAAARLGAKSVQLETRLETFLKVASYCGGAKPVALRYCGAETSSRWSGVFALNDQNLPRIQRDREENIVPKLGNALRMGLRAPKGKKVVVADLSGIELRVNMFLWKVPYALKLFQESPDKADLYKYFASRLYEIEQSDVTKQQRQVGKVSHLGLGFGSGADTFQRIAKTMGGVEMGLGESKVIVDAYRTTHEQVRDGWNTCHEALNWMGDIRTDSFIDPWGMCKAVEGGIQTPRGMIRYPGLHQEAGDKGREWWYGTGRHRARIYGPKVCENIVQSLARHVIAGNMVDFSKTELGKRYAPAGCYHDELAYVVDEADAQDVLDTLQGIMRTPPVWFPQLIVWSEGDIADTYGAAK